MVPNPLPPNAPLVEELPPAGSRVDVFALHLSGEHWKITVDGQPLSIEFGPAFDQRGVSLSGGNYGSEGKWWATGSAGFQILTDTHIMQVWFVRNGTKIMSCGGIVGQRSNGKYYKITNITACQRGTSDIGEALK